MINTCSQLGMGALLLASIPMGGDMSLWAQWGLAGLVVGYTLWRDGQRERRMSEALEKHQDWVRNTLIAALERSSAALERIASKHGKHQGEDRN